MEGCPTQATTGQLFQNISPIVTNGLSLVKTDPVIIFAKISINMFTNLVNISFYLIVSNVITVFNFVCVNFAFNTPLTDPRSKVDMFDK